MRLIHPLWTSACDRRENPLWAVDLHPDGSRVVTGGPGDDSSTGKICFWNMDPIRSGHKGESTPKMLCALHVHERCVNAVRWNSSGAFLASAGEDGIVLIWGFSKNGTVEQTFGSKTVNIENWKNLHCLKGHTASVQDLSWHPRSLFLASGGADNRVIIWNATNFPQKLKVLTKHTSFVKGVSWDPIGVYLATQSDDKTLRVWNVRDWNEVKSISEPFLSATPSTHFLRCDWSADGQSLVSAHAFNNDGPVAKIAMRKTNFSTKSEFLGHRKGVRCVRFHPMVCINAETGKKCCLVAIGSKDRSISIWDTEVKRPIIVIHEVFDDAITDISWGKSALELVCVARDGRMAYIDFEQSEVGQLLTPQEHENYLKHLYGDYLSATFTSAVVQNPDLLKFLACNKENSVDHKTESPMKKLVSRSTVPMSTKQTEVKAKDGRRRITPICIAPIFDEENNEVCVPTPFSMSETPVADSLVSTTTANNASAATPNQNGVSSTTNGHSSNGIDLYSSTCTTPVKAVLNLGVASPDSSSNSVQVVSATVSSDSKVDEIVTSFDDEVVATVWTQDSNEQVVHENSFEVQEKLVSEAEEDDEEVQKMKKPIGTKSKFDVTREKFFDQDSQVEKREKLKNDRVKQKLKRRLDDIDSEKIPAKKRQQSDHSPRSPRKEQRSRVILGDSESEYETAEESVEEDVEDSENLYTSLNLIPAVPIRDSFHVQNSDGMIDVTNNQCVGINTVHSLKFTSANSSDTFQSVFSSPIIDASCSSNLVAVACEDDTISVFNLSGFLILSPLLIDSRPVKIVCKFHYVMCVTSEASVSLWNLKKLQKIFTNSTLANLFDSVHVKLLHAFILDNGLPVIVLSTNRSYSYHVDMDCWVLLQDKTFVNRVNKSLPHAASSSGPLSAITELTPGISASEVISLLHNENISNVSIDSETLQQGVFVKYSQLQESAARHISSGEEYKHWMLCLVTELTRSGCESVLKHICDDLLGPVLETAPAFVCSGWESNVFDVDKKDLLRQVLAIIASNLQLQRLFGEYNQIFKQL